MRSDKQPPPAPIPPTVTFIVPTYNSGDMLKACVESIRNQDFEDFEVLIIDDGSMDNTQHIAARIVTSDRRVRYFRHERQFGHVYTCNEGLGMAAGELIWFLPANALLNRTTILHDFIRAFSRHAKLGFAFCRSQGLDENGKPSSQYAPGSTNVKLPGLSGKDRYFEGQDFFKLLLEGNCIPAGGAIARRQCYDDIMNFQQHLPNQCDWFNWLIFSLYCDVGFIPDAAILSPDAQKAIASNENRQEEQIEEMLFCLDETARYLKDNEFPKPVQMRVNMARAQFKQAHQIPLSFSEKTMVRFGKVLLTR